MHITKYSTLILSSLALGYTVSNASLTVNFNSVDDLNDFTSQNSPSILAGGIDGTTGLTNTSSMSTGSASMFDPQTFNASAVGFNQALSIYFKYDADFQTSTTTGIDRAFALGFTENSYPDDFGNLTDSVAVYLLSPSAGNVRVSYFSEVANSRVTSTVGSDVSLTDENWYLLDLNFNSTSATNWSISTKITNYGLDGVTLGSVLFEESSNLTVSTTQYANPMKVNLLRAENDRTGIVMYDNLTVPEPSTYALCFGMLALGSVIVRRRLRK